MSERGATEEREETDWTARHARTKPSESQRVVRVPDGVAEDWELRHAETKRRD